MNISDLEASLMSSSVVTCSLLRKEAGKLEVESFGKTGRTMPLKISRSHFQEVRRSLSSPSSEVRGISLVSRVFLAFKESNSIWSRFISDSVTVVFYCECPKGSCLACACHCKSNNSLLAKVTHTLELIIFGLSR